MLMLKIRNEVAWFTVKNYFYKGSGIYKTLFRATNKKNLFVILYKIDNFFSYFY